jgi:hypothetical protein
MLASCVIRISPIVTLGKPYLSEIVWQSDMDSQIETTYVSMDMSRVRVDDSDERAARRWQRLPTGPASTGRASPFKRAMRILRSDVPPGEPSHERSRQGRRREATGPGGWRHICHRQDPRFNSASRARRHA